MDWRTLAATDSLSPHTIQRTLDHGAQWNKMGADPGERAAMVDAGSYFIRHSLE